MTKSQMKAALAAAKRDAAAKKTQMKAEIAFKLEMARIEYSSRDEVIELRTATDAVETLISIVADITRIQPQFGLGVLVNSIVSLTKTIKFTKGVDRTELSNSLIYKSNLVKFVTKSFI